ncbi:CFS1-like protein, partial [Phlegmacium glaucopus]
LSKITIGEVTIISPERTWHFGSPSAAHPELNSILKVRSKAFWTRIAIFTDVGLAEAFMYGDVDCDDITVMLKILILNRKLLGEVSSMAHSIAAVCRAFVVNNFRGDLNNSRANISSHYDLGNTMFIAFLSKDMCYSSAIFKDYEGDIRPGSTSNLESLEDAQLRKMRAILKRLRIQPGDRVLEIGTGFGSFAILAAQTVPDCTIDTITLSIYQTELARKRIAEAGLSDRITVYNMDFRESLKKPEWKGAFDRFVSIEMIENVGKDFIPEYWRVVDWALKEDTAIGMVQVISMPESRIPSYDRHIDFVQKWVIFPGGYLPSLAFLVETMSTASQGRLTIDSVYNIGPHYARTLREWKRKFLCNWDGVIAKALVDQYHLPEQELEIFKRKWICKNDYCESGFATRILGDHCITFTREGNTAFGCDLAFEV